MISYKTFTRGSPRLFIQAVDCRLEECQLAAVSPRAFWWEIGQILQPQASLPWDPKTKLAPSLHANHRRRRVFFKDTQVPLAAKLSFWPWLPQERTHGACARAPCQQESQLSGRPRLNWLKDAELTSSSLAEAANPVVASSKPTSVQVGQVIHTTAFLVRTAFLARCSVFFCCERKMGGQESTCKNKKFVSYNVYVSHRKLSLNGSFLRNESEQIRPQSFEMQMGKKS